MMTAPQQEYDGGVFQRYLDLGFSVIPLAFKSKQPHADLLPLNPETGKPEWEPYRRTFATPATAAMWYEAGAGIGIVCGAVSGHLTVMDVDHQLFCNWLTNEGQPFLKRTWTVRTGSGLVHVYLYSDTPIKSTQIKTSSGITLADIRSEGEYVAAPPTIHPSGQRYRNLYRDASGVVRVSNALATFRLVAQKFLAAHSLEELAEIKHEVGLDGKTYPRMWQPAITDPVRKEQMEKLLWSLPRRFRRAVADGYDFGVGDWESCKSNSDVDMAIVCEMVRRNWTDKDIVDVYATYPVGDRCYRDPTRPNHGDSYLIGQTIFNARKDVAYEREQQARMDWPEWKVVEAVRINYEDPQFVITIERKSDGKQFIVRCGIDDLSSDRRFRVAAGRSCHWAPTVPGTWAGRNWIDCFTNPILAMARVEEVASEATSGGYLRLLVLETLRHGRIQPLVNGKPASGLGWSDERCVYVFPKALYAKVEAKRRNLTPQQLWDAIRPMGVERRLMDVEDERVGLFVFPKEALNPF